MPDPIAGADLLSAIAATLLVRAGAVLAVAWLLTRALSRAAASTRHAVWSAAFTSLLLLPLGAALLPRWNIPGTFGPLPVASLPGLQAAARPASMGAPTATMSQPHAVHGPVLPMKDVDRRGPSGPAIAFMILWAAGAAVGLTRLLCCLVAVLRLSRRASAAGQREQSLVDETRRLLGVRRAVAVRWSDAVTVPVNWGVLRPVILLPASAASWDDERLRVVLLHELAHVRRWDYPSLLATRLAQAFYWMNPLVWPAARQAEMDLERACDDEVLRAGTESVDYASHLFAIAEPLTGAGETAGALAMARPSTLRERVSAILARTTNRSPLGARAVAGAAFVMALVALPLAGVRLLGEGRVAAEERGALLSLGFDQPEWRSRAAFALGRRRATSAVPALEARLSDADPQVRGLSAWALGEIGLRRSLGPLAAALRDHDPHVREMAVLALGRMGDERALPFLEPLLHDSFMGVRAVLTRALEHIGGPEASRMLATIVTTDPDDHTRSMAIWSLRLVHGGNALPTLSALLSDTSASMRRMAAHNLGELGDPRAVEALARTATGDSAAQVRMAASWALGKLGTDRALEALAAAMGDRDWGVRVAAAEALGKAGHPRAADLLIAATRDSVHQVRLTAVEALEARAH